MQPPLVVLSWFNPTLILTSIFALCDGEKRLCTSCLSIKSADPLRTRISLARGSQWRNVLMRLSGAGAGQRQFHTSILRPAVGRIV